MVKKIFKLFLFLLVFSIAILVKKNIVFADAQCGVGYVCWESNGGTASIYTECKAIDNGSYCGGNAGERTCDCIGSSDCSCTLPKPGDSGGIDCGYGTPTWQEATGFCTDGSGACSGDPCGDAISTCSCDDGSGDACFFTGDVCGLYNGTCNCTEPNPTTYCEIWELAKYICPDPIGTSTIGCCYAETASPTPVTPTSTPIPGDPTPTPVPYFWGAAYDDITATPIGLGGTDNLCSGNTSTQANPLSGVVSISRSGESSSLSIPTASYNITTGSTNSDYTITLDLPFPPPDPSAAWQCACNADPADPYRCIYTNQQPSSETGIPVNFFVYLANLNNTAWWQTLGGHIYSETNIETAIPTATCIAPSCIPALIGADIIGNQDSAGFPSTNTGEIQTTITGDTYIHEADSRSTSLQGQAQGVDIPVENYSFFSTKLIGQAQTLANADKPTPSSNPGVYLYTGDLTITEANPWNVSNSEQIIVMVNGNLIFDDTTTSEARLVTVASGGTGFIQFIVSGNITVNSSVGYASISTDPTQANITTLEGVYLADGLFTIQGEFGTTDRKFIGAGTFVGWSGVQLERNFDDGATPTLNNTDATETFIYRPDLMVNTPQILKSAHITWQEIAPRWPGL